MNIRPIKCEECGKKLSLFEGNICLECEEMAIQALEQEPCDDAINRQAVKDWFCTNYCSEHNQCEHFEKGDCNAMNELFAIPPVNPRKNIVNNGTMNITL